MTTFIGSLKERETNQGKRRRERPAPHSEISLCQGYHNAIKKAILSCQRRHYVIAQYKSHSLSLSDVVLVT